MNVMGNLISKEYEQSKLYMLETWNHEGRDIVALTPKNVAKVEAMIRNDSRYLKASQKGNMEASPFWILEMKKSLENPDVAGNYSFDIIVENVVRLIDKENSTHLNSDLVGRSQLADRLIQNKEKLIQYLKFPRETNLELIRILSERTTKTANSKNNRCNLSFASKFCHYACMYMFEGFPEQDNFSIFDSIVLKALPSYCDYLGLKKVSTKKLNNYIAYSETIDQIIKKAGSKISRNGFDHLIWYYFKGRQPQKTKRTKGMMI